MAPNVEANWLTASGKFNDVAAGIRGLGAFLKSSKSCSQKKTRLVETSRPCSGVVVSPGGRAGVAERPRTQAKLTVVLPTKHQTPSGDTKIQTAKLFLDLLFVLKQKEVGCPRSGRIFIPWYLDQTSF